MTGGVAGLPNVTVWGVAGEGAAEPLRGGVREPLKADRGPERGGDCDDEDRAAGLRAEDAADPVRDARFVPEPRAKGIVGDVCGVRDVGLRLLRESAALLPPLRAERRLPPAAAPLRPPRLEPCLVVGMQVCLRRVRTRNHVNHDLMALRAKALRACLGHDERALRYELQSSARFEQTRD